MTKLESQSPVFGARELRSLAGLSYRQLNDWESRGAIPIRRGRRRGWRTFSPREIFAVMVVAKLRDVFGVPVERLVWVQKQLLRREKNFRSALMWAGSGQPVVLGTDLKKIFVVRSKLGPLDTDACIVVKIDDIAKRILLLSAKRAPQSTTSSKARK